jgi:cell division inhibitor SulA
MVYLETAQHIAQCGRINKQQMRAVLDACSSSGSNKAVVKWLMCTLELTQQERDSWMLAAAVARGDTLHDIQLLVGKVGKHAVEAMSRALLTASNKNRVDVVDWLTTHTAADASIKMKCEMNVRLYSYNDVISCSLL